MDFNRFDLIELFGKDKANSIFVKLRKEELGYFKMLRCERTIKNSNKVADTLCSMVFFNPDNVIEHYNTKKEKYLSNSFLVARPLYLDAWDKSIKIAKHFKEINNDT